VPADLGLRHAHCRCGAPVQSCPQLSTRCRGELWRFWRTYGVEPKASHPNLTSHKPPVTHREANVTFRSVDVIGKAAPFVLLLDCQGASPPLLRDLQGLHGQPMNAAGADGRA